jgi:hypothetical protein
MRATIRVTTAAVHAVRRVLPSGAGLAAGAATAGDPGPLLERNAGIRVVGPRGARRRSRKHGRIRGTNGIPSATTRRPTSCP